MTTDTAPAPRRPRLGTAASRLGALALFPAAALLGFWAVGASAPVMVASPLLVLGGLAVALLANLGARLRGRMRLEGGVVLLECDLRLRYRGANLVVVLLAGALATGILLFLLWTRLSP